MKIFSKEIIKHVLKFFGWKLIKNRSRAALAYPHPLPSSDHTEVLFIKNNIQD